MNNTRREVKQIMFSKLRLVGRIREAIKRKKDIEILLLKKYQEQAGA